MKHVFLSILFLVGAFAASAQTTYFEPVSSAQARLAAPVVQNIQKYAVYQLKESALRSYLAKAPLEFTGKGAALLLDIPLPNGTVETFAMLESPILAPAIAARHPDIKTYSGTGTTHKDYTIRLSLTVSGFDAIILGVEGDAVYYTKASADRASRLYLTYFAHDVKKSKTAKPSVGSGKCGSIEPAKQPDKGGRKGAALNNTGTTLRTFRLAIAATGEFTKQAIYGGDVNSAFAGVVGYVNRMNAVFNRELSVAFTLVSDVNLVFPEPTTDPYTNTNQITMLAENQVKLDEVLTNTGYDVGHVISLEGGSGGGVAQGSSVCSTGNKAKGVSGVGGGSLSSMFPPIFDDQLLSHEIGHQFAMNHSFNSSLPVCTTRNATTSVEPGAGVTIMSYGFTCSDGTGNDNYETPAYAPFLNFHTANYQEAATFINTLTCFTATALANVVPVIGTFPAATTIPKSTPFALTGTATDADAANVLSYSWEGTNIGTMIPDGTTLANTAQPPFFRSYQPVATGTRTFPRLSAILNGTNYAKGDKLPSVGIATTHRLTVRDNAGGLIYQEVTVTIDGNSGPFLETTNLTGSHPGNSVKTITWDAANTTAAPINCANVDILLSTDGGMTFPTMLLANTPNDGSEPVTLPEVLTSTARIKVAGSNTIFFDISNANFSIVAPAVPVVSLTSPDPNASEDKPRTQSSGGLQAKRSAAGRQAADGDSDPGSLRFERNSSVGELVVKYSLGGTATNGTDYVGLPGSLTFADGESVRDVPVTPIDDDEVEGDEDAVVTLTDEAAYDPDPAHTSGTVTIKENDTAPFSITGVSTVSCLTTTAGQRQLTFNPGYSGLSGQPVTFRVVNELSPTTNAGPYTLNPYIDNPTLALKAVQAGSAGEASFSYNWLAACTVPVVVPPTSPFSITGVTTVSCATVSAGLRTVSFSPLYAGVNGQSITFSVVNELSPTMAAGPYTLNLYIDNAVINLKATQSGTAGEASFAYNWLAACNGSVTPPALPFAITGVSTVSCTTISPGQRLLSFNPQYAGVSGQPITFRVVNESSPTTNPGPYTLSPYIDNPSFTLKATQTGSAGEASFVYNWLAACTSGARLGAEPVAGLDVRVLGNPTQNGQVVVEVRGAAGQPLQVNLTNMRGQTIGSRRVETAGLVERHTFEIDRQPVGQLLLRVSTSIQLRTVKVLKVN